MKPWEHGPLRVAPSGHTLQHADGTPFFWLADTCWEAVHRLTREEIEELVRTRAEQGFNVLQVVALAEFDGVRTPNVYGDRPLKGEDVAHPDEDGGYWRHVDHLFDTAAAHGLYVGLLPTWGDKVTPAWGVGPVVFDPGRAHLYGEWIGGRYGGRDNLIWINGGDRDPKGHEATWRALAEGVRAHEGPRHLMTFHPQGGQSSAETFHGDAWLDLNMLQTGHGDPEIERIKAMIQDGYRREPAKPVLDGEPRYENHPIEFDPRRGYFLDGDVRQAVYTGLFAGGCGFTYGCHAIWQFACDRYDPVNNPISHWRYSLNLPGARQMGRVRELLLRLGFPNVEPAGDQTLKTPTGLAVYLPQGGTHRAEKGYARATWLDPRGGEDRPAQSPDGHAWPAPESKAKVNDWILHLEE